MVGKRISRLTGHPCSEWVKGATGNSVHDGVVLKLCPGVNGSILDQVSFPASGAVGIVGWALKGGCDWGKGVGGDIGRCRYRGHLSQTGI